MPRRAALGVLNALFTLQTTPEPSSSLSPLSRFTHHLSCDLALSHSSPSSPKSPLHEGTNGTLMPRRAALHALSTLSTLSAPPPRSLYPLHSTPLPLQEWLIGAIVYLHLKSLVYQFLSHGVTPKCPHPAPSRHHQKVGVSPFPSELTNDFDPFTKLNLNSSLDRANSKTYNPWEMISRLQTIAKTVPFHPKLYKRSPVNRSPGILTETITASLLQGNHRMNSARLQV